MAEKGKSNLRRQLELPSERRAACILIAMVIAGLAVAHHLGHP
jgi:hypothetical protein